MQAFIVYIYDYLLSDASGMIQSSNQTFKDSDAYQAWRNDTISLHDFIIAGIEGAWLDTSKLSLSEDYYDTENIYQLLV